MGNRVHRRAIEKVLAERLTEAPVARLTGPRAVGKTTTCVAHMDARGATVVLLDDPDVRRAVESDPQGYLARLPKPILLDEYQRVPDVLDVIKSDLSRHTAQAPGQWLLCGSIAVTAVTKAAESLGGRVSDVAMGTLTVDERNDLPESAFLQILLSEGVGGFRGWRPDRALERDELIAEAIRGGFPLVTDRTTDAARRRGLEDWVNASVINDAAEVGGIRNTTALRDMLRLYAAATATVTPKLSPIADALGMTRKTVGSYRDLLASLYVTWDLPAFVPGNATGQVVKSPKLHLIDSGLAAYLGGRDSAAALARDTPAAGALVETMVANDLRVQSSVHDTTPRLYHFRVDSNEVDLVIERSDGTVVGVEIKLASNPGDRDLGGLRRLRDAAGSRWVGGLVLCRVPAGRLTDDGIALAPLEAVWQISM